MLYVAKKIYLIIVSVSVFFSVVADVQAADEPVPLAISVNTAPKGDYIVVLRDKQSVLINQDDLESLGLISLQASENIDGQDYVNLEDYSDDIQYQIDQTTLTLQLDVDPFYLQKNRRNLAKKTVVKSNPFKIDSAFLNASANVRGVEDKSYRAVEFPLEWVVSAHDLLLQTNFTYLREDIDEEYVTGTWYRGMSNITKDFTGSLERLTIGDFAASSGELGGSGIFAGLSYGKQFSMASTFTKYASLTVNGVLKTPSKLNLYANGNLIRTEQLPAGEFELENLPDLYGAGELMLEVEDAFGRITQRNLDYYVSTRLLRAGLHEFNYSLGLKREGFNRPDSSYATSPTLIGFHRYGVNEYLTLGFRLESDSDLQNYGPMMNMLLGPLGELEFKFAQSKSGGISAYSGVAKYSYTSRYFHMRFAHRQNQQDYATISSASNALLPSEIQSAGVGIHGTRLGGFSINYTRSSYFFELPQELVALNYSVRLGRKVTFFLRAQSLKHLQKETNSIFASINITIGKQVSTSGSYSRIGETEERSAYLQKSVPVGEGSGFRFRTRRVSEETTGVEYPGELNIIAKTRHNILNATYFKEKTINAYNVQFASTLAFIDNQWFVTRPIYDSFGLVKVGELDKVRVYYSNEPVGETHDGNVLVPNLSSYADNYLSIAAEDVPVDHSIKSSRKIISPKFRTGSVADFEVQKFQGFVGHIFLHEKSRRQSADYAELKLFGEAKLFETTVGKGGEFYLENLIPGDYQGRIRLNGQACDFNIQIPKSEEMLVDLGEHDCAI